VPLVRARVRRRSRPRAALPERPLVLGGCCCAHVGAVEGLAARYDPLAIVWLDAHGDLNTPATSPSGTEWGMPLRMLLDSETVAPGDVALVGARDLDPPEEEYIARAGLRLEAEGVAGAIGDAEAVYVALDLDVLRPNGGVTAFMPTPGGPTAEETVALLERIAAAKPVAGLGLTGLSPAPANADALVPFARALGL
jgi:arginase